MGDRFFIRCAGQGYITKSHLKRSIRTLYPLPAYIKEPGDHRVKTWPTRAAAERHLSHLDAATHTVVEAPSAWRRRDPQNDAEWHELAVFLGFRSGAALKEQIRLADEILTEIMAEERAAV